MHRQLCAADLVGRSCFSNICVLCGPCFASSSLGLRSLLLQSEKRVSWAVLACIQSWEQLWPYELKLSSRMLQPKGLHASRSGCDSALQHAPGLVAGLLAACSRSDAAAGAQL